MADESSVVDARHRRAVTRVRRIWARRGADAAAASRAWRRLIGVATAGNRDAARAVVAVVAGRPLRLSRTLRYEAVPPGPDSAYYADAGPLLTGLWSIFGTVHDPRRRHPLGAIWPLADAVGHPPGSREVELAIVRGEDTGAASPESVAFAAAAPHVPLRDGARRIVLARAADDPELIETVCAVALQHVIRPAAVERFGFPAVGTVDAPGRSDPRLDAGPAPPLGQWCLDHAIVPADPVRRVVFYLLTGAHEQMRAADPDGTLLTAAYGAAGDERAILRRAMTDIHDTDLVTIVAAAGRKVPATYPEQMYLIDRLADRRDWPALWRLACELPLVAAVRAATRIDGWRPPPGDADWFARLTAADPNQVSASIAAARKSEVHRLRNPTPKYDVRPDRELPTALPSFSPDRGRVAQFDRVRRTIWDRSVASEDHHATTVTEGGTPEAVLHLGESLLAVVVRPGAQYPTWVLMRYTADGAEELVRRQGVWSESPGSRVARHPDGFMAGFGGSGLTIGGPEPGSPLRHVRVPDDADGGYALRAASPRHDRALFSGGRTRAGTERLLLTDVDASRVIARGEAPAPIRCATIVDRDTVLVGSRGSRGHELARWRAAGDVLCLEHRASRPYAIERLAAFGPLGLVAVGRAEFEQRTDLIDEHTLTPVTARDRRLAGTWAPAPWPTVVADDGSGPLTWLSIWRNVDWMEAGSYDPGLIRAAELARRPTSDLTPADLRIADSADSGNGSASVAVDLLRERLLHRFGQEVALGSGPGGRADDIAIGPRSTS